MASPITRDRFVYRALNENELTAYREKGYLFYGRILTDAGLKEMLEQCMAAWTAHKQSFDPAKTWLENALLVNIHHLAPIVRDFYFEGPLVDVATQVIGPNIKGATSQLTFKMRETPNPSHGIRTTGMGSLNRTTLSRASRLWMIRILRTAACG